MGPTSGWIGGWAIIVADVIVMANLAQIAGLYTFLLFGGRRPPSTLAVTARRRRLDRVHDLDLRHRHRAQRAHAGRLLAAEIVTLALFAVVALVSVFAGDAPAGSINPSLCWFSPFAIGSIERARRPASCSRSSSTGAGTPR